MYVLYSCLILPRVETQWDSSSEFVFIFSMLALRYSSVESCPPTRVIAITSQFGLERKLPFVCVKGPQYTCLSLSTVNPFILAIQFTVHNKQDKERAYKGSSNLLICRQT